MLYQATRSLGVNAQVKLLCHCINVCVRISTANRYLAIYPMNVLRYHLHLEAKCLQCMTVLLLELERRPAFERTLKGHRPVKPSGGSL